MKKIKILALLFSIAFLGAGCQSKKELTRGNESQGESSKVSDNSKSKTTSSTESPSKADDGKKGNLSVADVEEIPASEFEKKKDSLESVMIFLGDPKADGYDKALKDFVDLANEFSVKVYKVNTDNQAGKELVKKRELSEPYDGVVMMTGDMKGHMAILNLKNQGMPPKQSLKNMLQGGGGGVDMKK